MAVKLSPAQSRALSKLRKKGQISSYDGSGVSSATAGALARKLEEVSIEWKICRVGGGRMDCNLYGEREQAEFVLTIERNT